MSNDQFYLKEGFFHFLISLESLRTKKEKSTFLENLKMSEDDFFKYVNFLKKYELKVLFDKSYVYPLAEIKTFKLTLNLSDWLAFQMLMQDEDKNNFFKKILSSKFNNKIDENSKIELKNIEEKKFETIKNEEKQFVIALEKCLIDKKVVNLKFENGKHCELLPLRIVFLDGVLSLVGEEMKDHILIYFNVEEIVSFTKNLNTTESKISQIEVNEFISHLRLVNGNEERLVLKLYSPEECDILPKNHFLGNPFVTSNPEGDMIWAASLEMCEDVYQWLFSMKDKVEVLDPGHIRKEFALFVENKKETAKKVS